MPPTEPRKHTKQCASRAFRPPFRERVAGSARGRASRIGERQSNDTCYLFGRTKQKTVRGQNHRPKQDKKRRNDTGSAVNNGGGKPPPYTYGVQIQKAGNSPRKERTHFPRTPLPVCGRELPASSSRTAIAPSAGVAQSPAIECQYSRHNNTRAGGRGTPP